MQSAWLDANFSKKEKKTLHYHYYYFIFFDLGLDRSDPHSTLTAWRDTVENRFIAKASNFAYVKTTGLWTDFPAKTLDLLQNMYLFEALVSFAYVSSSEL